MSGETCRGKRALGSGNGTYIFINVFIQQILIGCPLYVRHGSTQRRFNSKLYKYWPTSQSLDPNERDKNISKYTTAVSKKIQPLSI